MVHVNTERLIAQVSAQVSAIDGITYDTYLPQVSSFLGTFAEFMFKMVNRIDSPSAAIVASDAGTSIAFVGGGVVAESAWVGGRFQGWPWAASASSSGSALLGSQASTTSTVARKVLVTIFFSGISLPVASSIDTTEIQVGFVYGSDFATGALAASTGGVSSIYNLIPLPKPSGGEIPVGWVNVPNSYTSGDAVLATMLITDWREIQGYDMSAILGTIQQP